MQTRLIATLLVLFCVFSSGAQAGSFKRITIDGSFADWAGVPVAFLDEEDAVGKFDFKEVYLANDDQYLYVRVRLYATSDYGAHHHQVAIDRDADTSTGHGWLGIGSELLIEDGAGYQQKNGGFNEGGASNLDWAAAPGGQITEFEARISRDVRDAENLPVFAQNNFTLVIHAQNSSWETVDIAPSGEGLAYEFAPKPPAFTGSRSLVGLTSTTWRYEQSGTDLGTDWLAGDYDDQQAGWAGGPGLLGFGANPGAYPAPVNTALTTGRTTYYFRAHFPWIDDMMGVGLTVSSYLSDGAVFYLNGTEVKRLRMPAGPVSYTTPASEGPTMPGTAEVFALPPASLVIGDNVLAVETHQTPTSSTELVFGLSLTAGDRLPPILEDPSQPADRNVVEGAATTFALGSVIGTEPFSYQWFKDGVAIPGATTSTHTIPVVLVTDAGQYRVEVSNGSGQTVSSRTAVLTTTGVAVAITDPAQPADRTVVQGQPTTFTVAVAGSPLLSYQWFKDGIAILDATGPEHAIPAVSAADAGAYRVAVANRLNSVTSRTATLTVLSDKQPPALGQVTGAGTSVIMVFSEAVDEATAISQGIYTIDGGVSVQSAVRDTADPRVVTLTTTPLTFGTTYSLTIAGIKDLFNNPANLTAQFKTTILIDGNFDDWRGIEAAASETQETSDGVEFRDIYVASDSDFLFVRFSFYADVGPLGEGHYYHLYINADNDDQTGFLGYRGNELMIENGGGYQEKNGAFNEGEVTDMDLVLAPQAKTREFECRISRRATYPTDGLPIFAHDTIQLYLELINQSWASVDIAPPVGASAVHVLAPIPQQPGPLSVRLTNQKVEVSWTGPGTLESRDSLSAGSWAPVPNAASPYLVTPTLPARYYRLKQL